METKTEGIREQSAKYSKVQNLMCNVNEETLMSGHRKQNRRKAVGVNGVSKEHYDENAESNIKELVQRMRKFQYKPKPVKRVYIPKANGKQRPLGLPSYEDKLVQGVMAKILCDVYEPRFLDCSYGFRENRSAHDEAYEILLQKLISEKTLQQLEFYAPFINKAYEFTNHFSDSASIEGAGTALFIIQQAHCATTEEVISGFKQWFEDKAKRFSEDSIKSAINELEQAGFIQETFCGFQIANGQS